MAVNASVISEKVFELLRSYKNKLKMYDEEGNQTVSIADARRFYSVNNEFLVTLVEQAGDKTEIYMHVSKQRKPKELLEMITRFRKLSEQNSTLFSVKEYGSKITPKRFASDVVNESNMHGTKRQSFQRWNEARMIIKHADRIDETKMGARSRNISRIFIENAKEERFLFPYTHLAGARAMARHVGAGGAMNDDIGCYITEMTGNYLQLQSLNRHIYKNQQTLPESAFVVRECVRSKLQEMSKSFNRFQTKKAYYEHIEDIANYLAETKIVTEEISVVTSETPYEGSLTLDQSLERLHADGNAVLRNEDVLGNSCVVYTDNVGNIALFYPKDNTVSCSCKDDLHADDVSDSENPETSSAWEYVPFDQTDLDSYTLSQLRQYDVAGKVDVPVQAFVSESADVVSEYISDLNLAGNRSAACGLMHVIEKLIEPSQDSEEKGLYAPETNDTNEDLADHAEAIYKEYLETGERKLVSAMRELVDKNGTPEIQKYYKNMLEACVAEKMSIQSRHEQEPTEQKPYDAVYESFAGWLNQFDPDALITESNDVTECADDSSCDCGKDCDCDETCDDTCTCECHVDTEIELFDEDDDLTVIGGDPSDELVDIITDIDGEEAEHIKRHKHELDIEMGI